MPEEMNFGNLPKFFSEFEKSKVVILPVPYEGTVSYGKGTSKGPEAILRASHEFELYDIETDSEPYLNGIYTAKALDCPEDPEDTVKIVEGKVTEILDAKKFPIIIGGEHSISIGSARAYANRFENLSVLQLDAHADLVNEFEGSKYNHACTMRRISELKLPITQVGVRSMDLEERHCHVKVTRVDTSKQGWIEDVLESLTDSVFITLDVDVFDPSIMPSTGTPEPGGLIWNEVMILLGEVCKKKNVVGADILELSPIHGMHAPDYMIAKLVYKLIGYRYNGEEISREDP